MSYAETFAKNLWNRLRLFGLAFSKKVCEALPVGMQSFIVVSLLLAFLKPFLPGRRANRDFELWPFP